MKQYAFTIFLAREKQTVCLKIILSIQQDFKIVRENKCKMIASLMTEKKSPLFSII